MLKIAQECGGGLIGVATLHADLFGRVAVGVPAAVIELNEPHPTLGQTPGEQAVVGVPAGSGDVGAVHLADVLRLALHVDQVRHTHLHAESEFVLRDAGGDGRIVEAAGLFAVELVQRIEHATTLGACDAGGVVQVQNRIALPAEFHALKTARQKTRAPQAIIQWLTSLGAAIGGHGHERRQVGVFATKPVAHPRAQARAAGDDGAGLEQSRSGIMIDGLGVHALDHAQVIDELGHMLLRLTHPRAGLAMPRKVQGARRAGKRFLPGRHRGFPFGRVNGLGHFLAMPRGKVRLIIEQIHLGRAARLKEIDHTLHLGCKMRKALQSTDAIAVFGGHIARVEQRPQRHRT